MSLELGHRIKEQWQKVLEANKKYPENETVRIPLTKLDIDSKSVYLFLREFSTMLSSNPNLFTLVHDGSKALRAYAEEANHGVYNRMEEIKLDGWEQGVNLSDAKQVYEKVKEVTKERTGIDVGILKMGHIDFFKKFEPVFDEKKSNLESMCHMYECAKNAIDNNLIAFYPEPKVLSLLKETKKMQISPEKIEKYVSKWVPNKNYGVLIRTGEGLVGLVVSKQEKNLYVEFPREEVDSLSGEDLKSLTNLYRKRLGLSLAIGLEAPALKGLADKITSGSLKDEKVVEEVVKFLKKGYKRNLYLSVNPVIDFVEAKLMKRMPYCIAKKAGVKVQKKILE